MLISELTIMSVYFKEQIVIIRKREERKWGKVPGILIELSKSRSLQFKKTSRRIFFLPNKSEHLWKITK